MVVWSVRMYRLVVDRLTRSNHPPLGAYTVASVGYRVYPDADTSGQVSSTQLNSRCPQLKVFSTPGIESRLLPNIVLCCTVLNRMMRLSLLAVGALRLMLTLSAPFRRDLCTCAPDGVRQLLPKNDASCGGTCMRNARLFRCLAAVLLVC